MPLTGERENPEVACEFWHAAKRSFEERRYQAEPGNEGSVSKGIALGGTGEGFDSPVWYTRTSGAFEFRAVASETTGGPKRPPVPLNAVNPI